MIKNFIGDIFILFQYMMQLFSYKRNMKTYIFLSQIIVKANPREFTRRSKIDKTYRICYL